jgi:hypothetical protein
MNSHGANRKSPNMRDQIFISYSHRDKRWLDILETNLKPLVTGSRLKIWSDRQIEPGEDWKADINNALAAAKVAVLLVSPDFLASEFITEYELPAFLEAERKNELKLLWVPVSHSNYKHTLISRFQSAYDPTEPLDSLPPHKRGKAIVEISEKIKFAFDADDSVEGYEEKEKPLVVLLYKRRSAPDERVLQMLSEGLLSNGYRVFIDKHMKVGIQWAQEIAEQVRNAHAVIPLLSPASVLSEMLSYEVETAFTAQQQQGKPHLLPVRINFEDALPQTLASILDPIQYALWHSPQDDHEVLSQLISSLHSPPPQREAELPKPPPMVVPTGPLESPWGAVPLKSNFYIERPTDASFFSALEDNVGIILVKGPRQMGKTSLLARGLREARKFGSETVVTDLQALNASHMISIDTLFQAFSKMIAEQFEIKVRLDEVWDPEDGANTNFRRFLKTKILTENVTQLVWALDEADRLFTYDYKNDVFGLFRALYNARELEPDGPWDKLTIAIIYATEAHLFITDPNMSPFNVGTPIELKDFEPEQVAVFNSRFAQPAPLMEKEIPEFCQLVGGHPYLLRRGLYEMKKHGVNFQTFKARASAEDGPYGDHLHRILALLARDQNLLEEVRAVVDGGPCSVEEKFYRLRSAGVITGDSPQRARIRCEVYQTYLDRHIPRRR